MTDVTFATARLIGEPLQPSHLGEIVRMHRDPMVMATLGGLRDETSSQEYLDFNLSHWRRYGFGLWIVRDRADERVAGRAVLRNSFTSAVLLRSPWAQAGAGRSTTASTTSRTHASSASSRMSPSTSR